MILLSVTFDKLTSSHNNVVICEKIKGVTFEAYFVKKESKKLVIFFPGAIDRKKVSPPIYHRWSWHNKIHANTLFVNDPTLYLSDELRIGWLLGEKNINYTELMCSFINLCISRVFIGIDEVVFYGSSAGGFMALQVAANYPDAKVLVNNCQTNVLKYRKSHVDDLIQTCFSDMSESDVENLYGERVDLVKRFKNKKIPRKVIYMQNTADIFHMENHCLPFINSLKNEQLDVESSFILDLYRNDENGHGPISQELTISKLNAFLQE